jgi:hypothetical protein
MQSWRNLSLVGTQMKVNPLVITASGALGLTLLTACSSGTTPQTHSASATHASALGSPSHAASPIQSRSTPASVAATNAKLITDAIASGSASMMSSVGSSAAGPVMEAYIQFQALQDEASAAQGFSNQSDSVTQIPGGYQLCEPEGSSNLCTSFTGFRSDTSGRITDFQSDGQLISSRIAAGSDSAGSGLAISNVTSFLFGGTGTLYVTFDARDLSWHPVNTDPPFISLFITSSGSRFSYDVSQSTIPTSLEPGQSAAVILVFHANVNTGQLSLTENDSAPDNLIVSTTLHKIG